MILWFLRLFQQFRELEETATEAVDDVLEYRIRADMAEEQANKAQHELETTLKRLVNYQAIQAGGIQVPFPDVHIDLAKPVVAEDTEHQRERKQMREIQQERVNNSRRLAYDAAKAVRDLNGSASPE